MTRIGRLGLALGLLIIGSAVPASAAAAGPEHSTIAPYVVSVDAGVVCDFGVEWNITATTDQQLVFPVDAKGDQLVRIVGRSLVTVTNVDSGTSVLLRGGFREDLEFRADGSIDIVINGTSLVGYFPTDVGGPSMWWFKGHLHDVTDSTFTAVEHSFVGNATDLCAALS